MVVQDEDESGNCSDLSIHDRVSLNGADRCELAESKVSRALFK